MLQSYFSDFGKVDKNDLNRNLRGNVVNALVEARENNQPLKSEDVAKIAAYIAQLEDALIEEDIHAVDETFVLDRLKNTTGFDVRKEACTMEYMRAEDM